MDYSSEDYSDIIDLPHHQSERRPKMPIRKRAAQFKPFIPFDGFLEELAKDGEQYKVEGESWYDSSNEDDGI